MAPVGGGRGGHVQPNLPASSQELGQEGTVIAVLENSMFRIRLGDRREIVAHFSGRLRLLRIRLLPDDHVLVQVSRYDPSRGRILDHLQRA